LPSKRAVKPNWPAALGIKKPPPSGCRGCCITRVEVPGYAASSVPVGVLEIAPERTPCKAPMLVELADTIPPIVTEARQACLRGIPRVKQDKHGLPREPSARLTEQRQSQVVFGGHPLGHTRQARGLRFWPSVQTRRTPDTPKHTLRSWFDHTQAASPRRRA
jgi:hypothetical protein